MPEIVAEWAAEEAWNEELVGAPELSSCLRLRRLRGKQPPFGDWRRVAPRSWGRAVRQAAHEQEEEEPEEPMDVEKPDAEAEGEAETEEEQPKKRARTEFCRGRRVQPCIFARKGGRFGLAVQLHRGQTRCQFCDAKSLAEVAKDPIRKGHITRALRAWKEAGRQDIFDVALALVPEDARANFLQALKRPSRAAPAVDVKFRFAFAPCIVSVAILSLTCVVVSCLVVGLCDTS